MARRPSKLPLILLGAMTLFTFGGPIAIGLALRGGPSPAWPPDRPVEWAVLVAVAGSVAGLMAACCASALANRKAMVAPKPAARPPGRAGDRP